MQNKYSQDLATQQSGKGGREEEEAYDPRGIVHRQNPREIRDVSPIIYPPNRGGGGSGGPSQQYPSDYDYDDEMYSSQRDRYLDRQPSESLQRLKEQASRHVQADQYSSSPQGGHYDYPSTAAAVAAASGSPYRQNKSYQPKYEYEPEPQQQQHQQQQASRAQQGSECTGLVIGGMNVMTAEQKAAKYRQQQVYAREVADAAQAQPIHISRESYQERNRYKGNGLPGEHLSGRDGQGGGGGYERNPQQQERGHDGDHRVRGTSNGGGISSISFGGGGDASPSQQRMQRRGKQEEYASQLKQQMNYNVRAS